MGLLNKLEKQGSTLTDVDGGTPTKMDLSSQATKIFQKSQLDLDGKNPEPSTKINITAIPVMIIVIVKS